MGETFDQCLAQRIAGRLLIAERAAPSGLLIEPGQSAGIFAAVNHRGGLHDTARKVISMGREYSTAWRGLPSENGVEMI
ncbi:MAG: hypothetical protein JSW37_14345 [Anaerolineales bacterium]|nr:MAG: hypothetical protein JSW37_14345 [Anaerolineales bacterium]